LLHELLLHQFLLYLKLLQYIAGFDGRQNAHTRARIPHVACIRTVHLDTVTDCHKVLR
jgi:hypothetical protein